MVERSLHLKWVSINDPPTMSNVRGEIQPLLKMGVNKISKKELRQPSFQDDLLIARRPWPDWAGPWNKPTTIYSVI